jgi:hypothetical protein
MCTVSGQVHSEAAEIERVFRSDRLVEVKGHPHPGADDLREISSSFARHNVVIVHMSGHTIDGAIALEGRRVSTKGRFVSLNPYRP